MRLDKGTCSLNRQEEHEKNDLCEGFVPTQDEDVATVRVTHFNGSTQDFEGIVYDANRMENDFLVMEDKAKPYPNVYHVPNVAFWTCP